MAEQEPICLFDIAEAADSMYEAELATEEPQVLVALRASCRGLGLTRARNEKRNFLDCQIEGCRASCIVSEYETGSGDSFFEVEDPEDPDDGATVENLERECRLRS